MKRNFKRTISIILVAVMVLSTMAIATVSTSAASPNATYTIEVSTSGSDGCTADMIYITLNGKDKSTDSHYCGHFGYHKTDRIIFKDINIDDLQSITVKKAGFNGWYPNCFKITKTAAGESETVTIIYGGSWVEGNTPVTFNKDANVYRVDIKTSDGDGAGTDSNVYFSLIDKNDKESTKLNASSIHPSGNAFEKNDFASFYVCVPDDFDELAKVKFELGIWTAGVNWRFEYFNAQKVSGTKVDLNVMHSTTVNKMFQENEVNEYSC